MGIGGALGSILQGIKFDQREALGGIFQGIKFDQRGALEPCKSEQRLAYFDQHKRVQLICEQ